MNEIITIAQQTRNIKHGESNGSHLESESTKQIMRKNVHTCGLFEVL